MEASAAGAPPAAADAAEAQAPAESQGAPQEAQPVTADPQEQQTPDNDVHAQLQQMQQTMTDLQQQVQGEPPEDLAAALSPEEEGADLGFTPEELAAIQAGEDPSQMDPGQQEAQLDELDAYMQEQIQEALNPIVQERAVEKVQAFGKEHPDIMEPEILQRVEPTMRNFIERYGEGARYDTTLLGLAYKAAKAELADAGAVPAEQAAEHGASIEAQAGQTQVGESSDADEYVKEVLSAGSGGDVFT